MEAQTRHSVVIGDNIPQLFFTKHDFELEMCFQPDFQLEMRAEVWLSSGTSSNNLKPVLGYEAEIVDQRNDSHPIY